MSFLDNAKNYIASRGSSHTRLAYQHDLNLWLQFCSNNSIDPASPTLPAAISFRDYLSIEYAPLSIRRILASLSAIYSNQFNIVNYFTEKTLRRPPASNVQKTQIIETSVANDLIVIASERGKFPERDVAILWVLWSTGMRRKGIVSIRRDWIIEQENITKVRHILKGGKEVESELINETVNAIEDWLKVAPESKWLFCQKNGSALTPQAITNLVNRVGKAAGLHIHPHMFRASLITHGLDADISLVRVQAMAHHEDPRSTLGYDRRARGAGVSEEIARFRRR